MAENAAGNRSTSHWFSFDPDITDAPVRSKRPEQSCAARRVTVRVAALRATDGNIGDEY
jgi:hypothetical protein